MVLTQSSLTSWKKFLYPRGYKRVKVGIDYPNYKKKVRKGTRGMPWLSEAMKDVISCEKLRGFANRT